MLSELGEALPWREHRRLCDQACGQEIASRRDLTLLYGSFERLLTISRQELDRAWSLHDSAPCQDLGELIPPVFATGKLSHKLCHFKLRTIEWRLQ